MGKRIMALIMCLCLLVTMVGPVFAENGPKVSLEQAVAIAKQVLALPDDAKNVEVNYYEGGYDTQSPVWNLSWNIQSGQMYRYCSVGIDAETGDVRHLSAEDDMWRNRDMYKGQPKFDKEDAKAAVQEFLSKYAPERIKTYELDKINDDYFYLDEKTKVLRYTFMYVHRYKGIMTENSLSVSYDPYLGKVFNMWSNWVDPKNYPDPTEVITPEAAKQIFIDKVGLQLMYFRQDMGMPALTKEPKLVYLSRQNNEFGGPSYIDAKTGELFSPWGNPGILSGAAQGSELKPIVEGPVQPAPPALAKDLTMEEALQKAQAFLKLSDDCKLVSRRYNESMPSPGIKTWTFEWNDAKGGNYSVAVNLSTGEIVHFNMWTGEPEPRGKEPELTWEEGKELAIKFVKENLKEKAPQLALQSAPPSAAYMEKAIYYPRYNYSFVRLVNGIPYNGNSVNIEVDNTTGKVVGCWSNWEQRQFKPIGKVVTQEEAMATYLRDTKFELRYVRVEKPFDKEARILPEYRPFEYRIAYVPSGKIFSAINARTGEPMPLWDYSVGEEARRVIGKHWAVEQVVALVQSGIVQGDGKDFKLNESITRAEFAKLLTKAGDLELSKPEQSMFADVATDAWYYPYVASANLNGIVTGEDGKFRPDDPVTRQEMAVMLARLIEKQGYKFGAAKGDANFKDAKELQSYAKDKVTKLAELGLVSGDKDKNFRPQAKSTRAEAMNLIYMMLVKAI